LVAPALAAMALSVMISNIEEIILALEHSSEILPPLNALSPEPIAIHARNPVRFRDNPVASVSNMPFGLDVLLDLEEVSDHIGVWHNKAQLVKYVAESGQTEFAVHLGGIDINKDRLDTPAHNSAKPYHDIHCRLTGEVVQDAWISFNERWEVDREGTGAPESISVPDLPSLQLPVDSERHIARIGRTYFGPNPDGNSNPLPFSQNGERSIYDTLLAAIRSAQRFIFIEEQYFASDGTVNPPDPLEGTYHGELLAAASRCDRLVILLPSLADQPWGEPRRRRIISELRQAWGSRLLVGFPQRRPALGEGSIAVAIGRTRLLDDIGPMDTRFRLAPAVRVPKTPFWMWIDGELMLIHSMTRVSAEGETAIEVDVLRAIVPTDATHWFSTPRAHKKNSPVTHSRVASIYVHSKMMVVDDLFVSIGSANINRRGFFYDGEINAFAIPERLMAAADNPARTLRIEAWAQHLGLSPTMGAALLGDPIGATDLLLRSPWLGNRFTPLEAVDLKGLLDINNQSVTDGWDMMKVFLMFTGLAIIEENSSFFWNFASDPTSFIDPHRIFETF